MKTIVVPIPDPIKAKLDAIVGRSRTKAASNKRKAA